MNIFYPSRFDPASSSGGSAHIRQFLANFEALGDRVTTLAAYPRGRLARLRLLRRADVVYQRLEHRAPAGGWYGMQRRLLRRPVIAWELNTVPEFAAVLGHSEAAIDAEKRRMRRLAPRCDVAFCVSERLREYATGELGLARALVVPNGSDPDAFSPDVEPVARLRAMPDRVHVVWMGSTELPWHDFDLVAGAAERLWARADRERIVVHVLGPDFHAAARMPPNVLFHGRIRYDELPRWLAGCDVGLVAYAAGPADFGSPLKLFDYLAAGLAVVSTEQSQARQILAEIGGDDLVTPIGNAERVARSLVALADDGPRRRALGAAGRELIRAKYTWRHNALTIRGELDRLLRERRAQ